MIFKVIKSKAHVPSEGNNIVYLRIDNWNDYSFVTMFQVYAFDEHGKQHELSNIKIGYVGQTKDVTTYSLLNEPFGSLPKGYFSLGTDVEYYKMLATDFSAEWREEYLKCLQDVVYNHQVLEQAEKENVFQTSHLRGVKINTVRDQFTRILGGEVILTDFHFGFELPPAETFAGFELEFHVKANSKPSTNIHALIGRNGVGKTTLLNSMVKVIADSSEIVASFYTDNPLFGRKKIEDAFFSSLVSVAFSAFDPFDLPVENGDKERATQYSYVGLTDYADEGGAIIKSKQQLHDEFVESLQFCLSESSRKSRWKKAVSTLESDGNFAEMHLLDLAELEDDELKNRAFFLIGKMSSGHAIVIITLTQLVAKVEEKTLVLFDEPESHLHPPLLSALMRSLSQLLYSRNAIAIIATHSPVVLQEIPKSCVWKVFRERASGTQARPETETFGENVGTLTREVFGLEVVKSGYHTILAGLVSGGGTYDDILDELGGNLGFEAKGILRAMVVNRDAGAVQQ